MKNQHHFIEWLWVMALLGVVIIPAQAADPKTQKGRQAKAEQSEKSPLLPKDFLKRTPLKKIKQIAKERGHNMERIVDTGKNGSETLTFVQTANVTDDLCQSDKPEAVETAIEIIEESKGAERTPLTASMIASSHSAEFMRSFILKHIKDGKYPKLIKLLTQESVLRGANFEDLSPVATYWARLDKAKDPLAWLPLHVENLEKCLSFPGYHAGGSVSSIPAGQWTDSVVKPTKQQDMSKPVSKPPLLNESSSTQPIVFSPMPFDRMKARQAVQSWCKYSDETFEAKLLHANQSILPSDISESTLLNMNLNCLAGAAVKDVRLSSISPATAFQTLFGVASNGGAYEHGRYGAGGRLAAWETINALTGAPANSNFSQSYLLANKCKWFSFVSRAKWFKNVAWDLAIVCLRPDGRQVAVLAATDED